MGAVRGGNVAELESISSPPPGTEQRGFRPEVKKGALTACPANPDLDELYRICPGLQSTDPASLLFVAHRLWDELRRF